MSLQGDLLKQSRQLATREPRKPKQASLRRAISTAYYAFFHLLVDEATKLLLGSSPSRKNLRLCARRAFVHSNMKEAAKGFASGAVSEKIAPGLNALAVQPELENLAGVFIELQQARHEADYDALRIFTKAEALELVSQAEQAFDDWHVVKGTIQADSFLVSLLILKALKG